MKKLMFLCLFISACTRTPTIVDAGPVDDINHSCDQLENALCRKIFECAEAPELECKQQFDPEHACLKADKNKVDACRADLEKLVGCDTLPQSCQIL